MALLRPSMFPIQMVATAPKKQPSVYAPTVMPWTLEAWEDVHPAGGLSVSIWGKYFRNDCSVNRPPVTPCDPVLGGGASRSCSSSGTWILNTHLVISKKRKVYACDDGNGNIEGCPSQTVKCLHGDGSGSQESRRGLWVAQLCIRGIRRDGRRRTRYRPRSWEVVLLL